ncbi:MAG TPA: tRNA (guanosine(37)-N1)-methyltransferase TrmD [Nevskiaceae bacterium]|nr:tRNA (guanosine(37)-N1)-methyltransferase TrmD [Nevskiaceae bacterium]
MKIEVVTLFPELVEQVGRHGMPRIALEAGALQLTTRNPRDYSGNRWRRVDDRPYGGGPGMVMEAEPLLQAIEAAKAVTGPARVVALSPQGERFNQAWAGRLSREAGLVLVCGRYEAIDERLTADAAGAIDLELSLGDFIMSGGELAAMAVIDAIARLLPGVLGGVESAGADSFADGALDHPHYTRPEVWRNLAVPEVLMSGDHAAIRRWRRQQALGATWLKRPDLLDGLQLDEESQALLREFISQRQELKTR